MTTYRYFPLAADPTIGILRSPHCGRPVVASFLTVEQARANARRDVSDAVNAPLHTMGINR